MATRLPLYLMRDGQTRLGQSYFNPVWADLDSRLDTLERIKIDWNAQVAQLRELGLKRIDDYIRPLTDEVDQLLQQAKDETDGLAQTLVDEHLLPLVNQIEQILQQAQADTDGLAQSLVDEKLAPILAQAQQLRSDIQAIKQAATQDAAAIAQALADANWGQELETLENSVYEAISSKASQEALNALGQTVANKRDLDDTGFPRYDVASTTLATASTITLDLAQAQTYVLNITGDVTFVLENEQAANRAQPLIIHLYDASLPTRLINWFDNIVWNGGAAPEFSGTEGAVVLVWSGLKWLGSVGVDNA